MSGSIKPFEHIKQPARKGLATVKYVERRLREVLGKLHFTGTGVKSSADGQIQIDASGGGGDDLDHPFKIAPSGTTGITLSPGYLSMTGMAQSPVVRINGQSIIPPAGAGSNWPAPVLAVPTGTSNIVLEVNFTPQFDSLPIHGVPIHFITGATVSGSVNARALASLPQDVRAAINYPEGTTGEGRCYIRIGQVTRAAGGAVTVLAQDWRNNIAASPQGDGYLFLAAR